MLTDVFAERYRSTEIWSSFSAAEKAFLVQGIRLVAEQLYPYWRKEGKADPDSKEAWTELHDALSRELGLMALSERYYSYQTPYNGTQTTVAASWTMDKVCENFIIATYNEAIGNSPDLHMKARVSFFELALRRKGQELEAENQSLPARLAGAENAEKLNIIASQGRHVPRNYIDWLEANNRMKNEVFSSAVAEFNERMKRCGFPLNYHNGFIQLSNDALIENTIATPFWGLLIGEEWKNVDLDMKEAFDLRDNSGRDPAFYAARALESTLKIISKRKNWTTGKEKGAHNYIDNLGSKAHGCIAPWESDALKMFFTKIRNPMGHGSGNEAVMILNSQQTDWAIETCMSWIKALIKRL